MKLLVHLLAVLTLTAFCPRIASAACDAQHEAERQAEFARVELTEEKWERALKSAESALRLCPDFHDALLLKAQAYEGADDLGQSRATLEAVLEIGAPDVRRRASELLQRLTGTDGVIHLGYSTSTPGIVASTDPEPFRERVIRALDRAQCGLAVSAAEELRRAAPAQPEGWALLAQGLKCAGRNRDAVRVIDEVERLGGLSDDLDTLRSQLRAGLATLDVRLEGAPPDVIGRFWIETPSARIDPDSQGPTDASFRDLPSGVPMTLLVRGRGLTPIELPVESLRSGEATSIEAATSYSGLGTIEVADYSPADVGTVAVESGGEVIGLPPGASVRVTAGPVSIVVGDNPEYPVRVERHVDREGTLHIDPTPLRPTRLTVSGVPAGTRVRVSVVADDFDLTRTEQTLPDAGEIAADSGLRIGNPVQFDSLVGGEAGLAFEHPTLGLWRRSTALTRGTSNGLDGTPDESEALREIEQAWSEWKAAKRAAEKDLRSRAGFTAVVGGVLLGAGAAAIVGAVATYEGLEKPAALGCGVGPGVDLNLDCGPLQRSLANRRLGLATAGGISVGLSMSGFLLSGVFGARAEQVQPPSGPWDPWAIDREGE